MRNSALCDDSSRVGASDDMQAFQALSYGDKWRITRFLAKGEAPPHSQMAAAAVELAELSTSGAGPCNAGSSAGSTAESGSFSGSIETGPPQGADNRLRLFARSESARTATRFLIVIYTLV